MDYCYCCSRCVRFFFPASKRGLMPGNNKARFKPPHKSNTRPSVSSRVGANDVLGVNPEPRIVEHHSLPRMGEDKAATFWPQLAQWSPFPTENGMTGDLGACLARAVATYPSESSSTRHVLVSTQRKVMTIQLRHVPRMEEGLGGNFHAQNGKNSRLTRAGRRPQ